MLTRFIPAADRMLAGFAALIETASRARAQQPWEIKVDASPAEQTPALGT